MDTKPYTEKLNGDEFIDSVKEVNITIRDHRADEDFERMLAELNAKKGGNKSAAVQLVKDNKPTAAEDLAAAGEPAEDVKSVKNNEPPKAVEAMSAAVLDPYAGTFGVMGGKPHNADRVAPRKAENTAHNQPKSAPQDKPKIAPQDKPKNTPYRAKSTAQQKADEILEQSVRRTAKPHNTDRVAPHNAKGVAPEKALPAPADGLKQVFGENSGIWNNPDLSAGGRVSMNIKTELRREITITVPPQAVERERQRVEEELTRSAKEDAQRRAALAREAEEQFLIQQKQAEQKVAQARERREAAERKKAADVRRKFSVFNGVLCFALFIGVGFYLLICPRASGKAESENRNLAKKPEFSLSAVVDGSYFEDLTKWYTDTIPFREQLKPFIGSFNDMFGIKLDDVRLTGDIAPVKKEVFEDTDDSSESVKVNLDFSSPDSKAPSASITDSQTESLADVPEELDDGEWLGNVVVSGSGENVRAMSAFYGTFDMGAKYAQTINRYKDALGPSVNVYTMNMPLSSAFYMPENLADQFTSQHDCIKNIGSQLNGIINVDVYDTLEEHKDEYIYSRTDHHWAPLGAYYAAKVFADTAMTDFADLDTYEECRIENFVGTMYAYSDYDDELKNNPDTFIYYKPDNEYTVTYYDEQFQNPRTGGSLFFDYAEGINTYSAILGTDDVIAEIETDCDNGRVLVIMKDSFGNALVPYLTHSFSKIYVCDFRYFKVNAINFCEKVGCTDFLFAVSLSAAHTESHINAIGNDRIQVSDAEREEWGLPEVVLPDDDPSAAADTAAEDTAAEDTAADDMTEDN